MDEAEFRYKTMFMSHQKRLCYKELMMGETSIEYTRKKQ